MEILNFNLSSNSNEIIISYLNKHNDVKFTELLTEFKNKYNLDFVLNPYNIDNVFKITFNKCLMNEYKKIKDLITNISSYHTIDNLSNVENTLIILDYFKNTSTKNIKNENMLKLREYMICIIKYAITLCTNIKNDNIFDYDNIPMNVNNIINTLFINNTDDNIEKLYEFFMTNKKFTYNIIKNTIYNDDSIKIFKINYIENFKYNLNDIYIYFNDILDTSSIREICNYFKTNNIIKCNDKIILINPLLNLKKLDIVPKYSELYKVLNYLHAKDKLLEIQDDTKCNINIKNIPLCIYVKDKMLYYCLDDFESKNVNLEKLNIDEFMDIHYSILKANIYFMYDDIKDTCKILEEYGIFLNYTNIICISDLIRSRFPGIYINDITCKIIEELYKTEMNINLFISVYTTINIKNNMYIKQFGNLLNNFNSGDNIFFNGLFIFFLIVYIEYYMYNKYLDDSFTLFPNLYWHAKFKYEFNSSFSNNIRKYYLNYNTNIVNKFHDKIVLTNVLIIPVNFARITINNNSNSQYLESLNNYKIEKFYNDNHLYKFENIICIINGLFVISYNDSEIINKYTDNGIYLLRAKIYACRTDFILHASNNYCLYYGLNASKIMESLISRNNFIKNNSINI